MGSSGEERNPYDAMRAKAQEYPQGSGSQVFDSYGIAVHTNEVEWTSFDFATRDSGSCTLKTLPKGSRPLLPTSFASYYRHLKLLRTLSRSAGLQDGSYTPLKGELKGFWSLAVSGNWRLIFRYDEDTNTASVIDLVDYH